MDINEIKSKIKNIYIMFLYSIMKEDIYRVKQHLSDDLVEYYKNVIENNISNNVIQKYGELNVAFVDIIDIKEDIIIAQIEAKYIDYKIDRNTKKFISGDRTRSSHDITLKIRYQKHNKEEVYRCPSCGAVVNVNFSGICEYCNEPIDDSESVYVIEEMI